MYEITVTNRFKHAQTWKTRMRTNDAEKAIKKIFGKRHSFTTNSGLNYSGCSRIYGYIGHYVKSANATSIDYDVMIDIDEC